MKPKAKAVIVKDKVLKTIGFSQNILRNLSRKKEAKVFINRHYIDDETVKINFNILDKRYLLVVWHNDIIHAEIWHTHNKGKYLIKEKYKPSNIRRGNFIKE